MQTETRSVQNYASKVTTKINRGVAMITSDDLWIGTLSEGIVKFNNKDTEFCQAVFRQWLDSTQVPNRRPSESQYRDEVAAKLDSVGWKVSKEVYTEYGRIDILAEGVEYGKPAQMIIEIKMTNKANDVSHALGQLLFYAHSYPKAELWFCCYDDVDAQTKSILMSHGVNVMEIRK